MPDASTPNASTPNASSPPDAPADALVADAQALYRAAVRRVQADRVLPADRLADALAPLPTAVRVAAFGKAALAMAGVAERHLQSRRGEGAVSGVAVVPDGYRDTLPSHLPAPRHIDVLTGGHPLPSAASEKAGQCLRQMADASGPGDLLLVLISGGGTALTSAPAGDLHVDDLRTTYQLLLHGGVGIHDANVVRKHLTQIGGGQLARAAAPARIVALAVSDVPGDDLSTIASGPTVPDASTYAGAMRVLYRNGLWREVPEAVREHLAAGANRRRPETPPADAPCFERATTRLVATNQTALSAMQEEAESRGYRVAQVKSGIEGEARDVGAQMAHTVQEASLDRPTCWLWGGESTVTVTGSGHGGRNQEVALGAARVLAASDANPDSQETNAPHVVLLSGGTDGVDGPTDAAGAWVTPATVRRAHSNGLDLADHLERNDAYPALDTLNALLRPGPTHTNVMDVAVALAIPRSDA